MNTEKIPGFIRIDKKCLGTEFAKRRKLADIKQQEAADWIGKTRAWLSQIECGILTLSLIDAYNLCRLYKCDLMTVVSDAVRTTEEYRK